jgi:hypothetical protein
MTINVLKGGTSAFTRDIASGAGRSGRYQKRLKMTYEEPRP